jgi:hypothetical protein
LIGSWGNTGALHGERATGESAVDLRATETAETRIEAATRSPALEKL